jgi:hypothetical protein
MQSKSRKSFAAIASWCLALFGAATLCSACGDDGGGDGDAGTGTDTDTDTDADGGANGTLEVLVLSHSWDADPAPAEGALVTLDKPGGERVELTAGADGTVAFDGIDWSLGEAAATASMDGHGMASRVGITEADGAITLRIRVEPLETVTLSGTVTNMADEGNNLVVNTLVCGGAGYQGPGPGYEVEVPAGVPFVLDGSEYTWSWLPSGQGAEWTSHNVFIQEMDPVAGDATSDITFEGDGGVETTEVSGSFDFSTTAGTPISGTEGTGMVYVETACDSYGTWVPSAGWLGTPVGWGSHVDINADGTAFDYTVEYIESSLIDQYFMLYFVFSGSGWTEVREAGVPTPGSHAIDLLDVPVVNTSSETGFVELAGDPVTWESADTDARPELVVFVGDYTWIISGPVGATSLAVPAPPAGAALTEPIETNVHEAVLTLLRDAADATPELWLGARVYSPAMAVEYVP